MKANPAQIEQLGDIARRCDDPQNEAVLAGLVAASAILLSPSKWAEFTEAAGLAPDRLRSLSAFIPKAVENETSTPILEA